MRRGDTGLCEWSILKDAVLHIATLKNIWKFNAVKLREHEREALLCHVNSALDFAEADIQLGGATHRSNVRKSHEK